MNPYVSKGFPLPQSQASSAMRTLTARTSGTLAAVLICLTLAPGIAEAQTTFTVTVVTKTQAHPYFGMGEPSGYAINGVEGMELTLVRGQTYLFQMSDVAAMHPFYISTSSSGAGVGVWEDGVTGNFASGNDVLTFVVPEDAPDELWYQCSTHAFMGYRMNIESGTGTEPEPTAPIFVVHPPAPNPARGSGTILLDLPEQARVTVVLFDVRGRPVLEHDAGTVDAGASRAVRLDLSGLAAGTYLIRATAETAAGALTAGGRLVVLP
jgi:hypothetical protein